jgi:hypothetical protein
MFQAMAGSQRAQDAGNPPGTRGETTREVLALRNLVAVYRHLSGLALQNADIAAVTHLIAEQTHATVAIVSPTMDILTAAAPGETGERAARGWSSPATAISSPSSACAGPCDPDVESARVPGGHPPG